MNEGKYVANQLQLIDEFHELVVSGKKTSTIRLGIVLFNDNILPLRFSTAHEVKAEILKVDYSKRFQDLTPQDAAKDGFDSLQALQSTLLKFYPDIAGNSRLTVIDFRLI